jgi:hypothetical protein
MDEFTIALMAWTAFVYTLGFLMAYLRYATRKEDEPEEMETDEPFHLWVEGITEKLKAL